jgi:hypothetical protein
VRKCAGQIVEFSLLTARRLLLRTRENLVVGMAHEISCTGHDIPLSAFELRMRRRGEVQGLEVTRTPGRRTLC